MTQLHDLYQNLERFSQFEAGDNTEKFLATVDSIVMMKDPTSIKVLLRYFNDDSDYDWAFESLVHAIECYSMEEYIAELIKEIPFGLKKYPYWLDKLINRIFNDSSYLLEFKKSMNLIPQEKMILLLELVSQESPHHAELCFKLKQELMNKSEI